MSYDSGYDPQAVDGDAPGRSAYVSRKDVKVIGIALIVLGLLMYPVFQILKRKSERARCTTNIGGMMHAMNLYADQNDDKFPPLFNAGSADEPMLQTSGAPATWVTTLQDYMPARANFRCPTADDDELTFSQDSRSEVGKIPVSYGMFAPMSCFNRSLVEDPDEAILIGETSNLGSNKTYDPLPFKDAAGKTMPYDGMAIGWDNDNFDGNSKTKYVTRLAFPGSASAVFKKTGEGRHDEGTFVLSVTGHIRTVNPTISRVMRRYKELYGTWPMPLTAKRHP